jgi:hypothetical protein
MVAFTAVNITFAAVNAMNSCKFIIFQLSHKKAFKNNKCLKNALTAFTAI